MNFFTDINFRKVTFISGTLKSQQRVGIPNKLDSFDTYQIGDFIREKLLLLFSCPIFLVQDEQSLSFKRRWLIVSVSFIPRRDRPKMTNSLLLFS